MTFCRDYVFNDDDIDFKKASIHREAIKVGTIVKKHNKALQKLEVIQKESDDSKLLRKKREKSNNRRKNFKKML